MALTHLASLHHVVHPFVWYSRVVCSVLAVEPDDDPRQPNQVIRTAVVVLMVMMAYSCSRVVTQVRELGEN